MKKNDLTTKEKGQISRFLKLIILQSKLFSVSGANLLLIKIPFYLIEKSCGISFAEARLLIQKYLNKIIGTSESYIEILNGTICKDGNSFEADIGTMITGVFEKLEGVDVDDEKDSLILWVNNWDIFRKNADSFLGSQKDESIKQLEFLEDKNEIKRITIYVNKIYENPLEFRRGKYWQTIYKLAKEKEVHYEKGFFDYFNSNENNPLYKKYGFKITQILRSENNIDYIVPNIKINLITQKKVTQQLNSA